MLGRWSLELCDPKIRPFRLPPLWFSLQAGGCGLLATFGKILLPLKGDALTVFGPRRWLHNQKMWIVGSPAVARGKF